ncbi:DDE-type integrase/transposase/recombinase [Saccharothrix sp. NEAU-S10]|nr:DDE-type integrase/transposase/recombinase [Saccharothrix luteola]
MIREIHVESFQVYGAPRVHAELTLGRGITVGHNTIALLMRRNGIKSLPNRRRPRPKHDTPTAVDLVDRDFARPAPNQLWVTDITEHPTREGKVYCAVVLDVHSRRVVGWSIDSSQTAALATNALGMAISNRSPLSDTVIHSDHEVQGEFNWSSQHFDDGGVGWDGRGSRCRRRRAELDVSGPRIGRCGRRCAHRGVRSRRGRFSGISGV